MKIGIIVETNNPEKAWNGVRFGNAALHKGHEVKIFLMGAGVEIESVVHDKFNARRQIEAFVKNKGIVLACGTCMQSRNQEGTEVCPVSTMDDCVSMVDWADKVITF